MKLIILIGVIVAGSALPGAEIDSKWALFKAEHGKNYHSRISEQERKNIFLTNLKEIEEHNARYERGLESFTMGVNQFSDLTAEEFEQQIGMKSIDQIELESMSASVYIPKGSSELPEEFSWVDKGAVTRVKNQNGCGSCYAFASTGALEGHYFVKTGKLVELSEQHLMNCAYPGVGCSGGHSHVLFDYVKENGAISEAQYPYTADESQKCNETGKDFIFQIDGYNKISNEAVLARALVENGPISVYYYTTHIKNYRSGVIDSDKPCNTGYHASALVGYGTENGKDYWLIKNSWGERWGDKGYFKMVRGKNFCSIMNNPIYPVSKM